MQFAETAGIAISLWGRTVGGGTLRIRPESPHEDTPFAPLKKPWNDSIPLEIPTNSAFTWFVGGAGFRPSIVLYLCNQADIRGIRKETGPVLKECFPHVAAQCRAGKNQGVQVLPAKGKMGIQPLSTSIVAWNMV